MSVFKDVLSKSVQEKPETTLKPSPWGKFLGALDSKPNMPEDEVKALFAKTLSQASSDWKDSNDNTLLIHMASRGQIGIVKRLIHELYANVNAANKNGTTALHVAASNGSMEVCTELLNSHADPCKKDQNGTTPAMLARNAGHTTIADLLSKEETAKHLWSKGAQFFGQQKQF